MTFNTIRMAILIMRSMKYKLFFNRFGKMSFIKSPIFINNIKYINVGDNVKIWHGARIEAVDKYNGKRFMPAITIEDNVAIQQNFHCTCASEIYIGKGTAITQNVGIFDINHQYEKIGSPIIDQDISPNAVYISENCFIGMNSVILPGTKLGKQNIVAAGSIVSGEFPDYCVLAGVPAKVIKKYNPQTELWERIFEK